MAAAVALSSRGRGRTGGNPNVGCVLVCDGRVVGRGVTADGGRPHAEAVALAASDQAAGATAYVTLEPCAHPSGRGPACADNLIAAGVARVVAAMTDPDPRTAGKGFDRLRAAGIEVVVGTGAAEAERKMAGFLTRQRFARPHVTLKLAMSIDGAMAMADGRSRWITGPQARAHAHVERSRHEAILVGRGTMEADQPRLDVRLPGLGDRSPVKVLLSSRDTDVPDGWQRIAAPADIAGLPGNHVLVEGGACTATALLAADLVDRLLLYRAPIVVGGGTGLGDIGLRDLADAHRRWALVDQRMLGSDRCEVYERTR